MCKNTDTPTQWKHGILETQCKKKEIGLRQHLLYLELGNILHLPFNLRCLSAYWPNIWVPLTIRCSMFLATLFFWERKNYLCVYTYAYIYNVYKHTYAYMCYICVIYIKCKFYNHYLTSHCSVNVTELKK